MGNKQETKFRSKTSKGVTKEKRLGMMFTGFNTLQRQALAAAAIAVLIAASVAVTLAIVGPTGLS